MNFAENEGAYGLSVRLNVDLQCSNEGFLRDVDLTELPHALFAFLLLLEQLALARPIAAWIGTWNMCGGMSSLSFSAMARPRLSARVRCTSIASASTGSPLTSICSFTRSASL